MDWIAERPTISGRSLTGLVCRVKRVSNECRANLDWGEFRDLELVQEQHQPEA